MNEKPRNGIHGLKHWRYDLGAGLQVALVSLPLSLGIAIASGAPPVTGVISAIIAGLVFPFLGGAYVTISGPAAGLAPALLSGMLLLGGGDLAAGYPLVLVAICLTGLLQVVLASTPDASRSSFRSRSSRRCSPPSASRSFSNRSRLWSATPRRWRRPHSTPSSSCRKHLPTSIRPYC